MIIFRWSTKHDHVWFGVQYPLIAFISIFAQFVSVERLEQKKTKQNKTNKAKNKTKQKTKNKQKQKQQKQKQKQKQNKTKQNKAKNTKLNKQNKIKQNKTKTVPFLLSYTFNTGASMIRVIMTWNRLSME